MDIMAVKCYYKEAMNKAGTRKKGYDFAQTWKPYYVDFEVK